MPDLYEIDQRLDITSENVGDFLLNVLTRGLYNQPDLILREYIQNSHDAICGWEEMPTEGRIDIKVDWPDIHIRDNGPGMNRTKLATEMKNIGRSNKVISETTGFMGIGKLAGLSMASTVEVHSSVLGDPNYNWVRFDSGQMLYDIMQRRKQNTHQSIVETLNEHVRMNEVPVDEDPNQHYTSVHLLGIQDEYKHKITDLGNFIRSIALISPVIQDPAFEHSELIDENLRRNISREYRPIPIYVNGERIYRPYVEGLDRPSEIEIFDSNGNLMAYGWASLYTASERNRRQIPEKDLQGISLVKRGIPIGTRELPRLMGLYESTSNLIYFKWYCGEIYIVDEDIVVSADRTRIRQSERTLEFVTQATKEFQRLAKRAERYTSEDNAITVLKKEEREVNQIRQNISSSELSRQQLPSVIAKLGKAQSEIEKRRRHIRDEDTKKDVDKLEETIGSIISDLVGVTHQTVDEEDNAVPISDIASDLHETDIKSEDDAAVKTESGIVIVDIADRLDFSSRETQIYRIISDVVAEYFGGRETDEFSEIMQIIEKRLIEVLDYEDD